MRPYFIELFDTKGISHIINVNYIVRYFKEDAVTRLYLNNNDYFFVKSSPTEIDEKIAVALKG